MDIKNLNKQFILLYKNIAFSKLPSIINQNDLCYFLSKDYRALLKLNTLLPKGCQVSNLAGKFQKEIKMLRKAYLDLFAELSSKNISLEWWATHNHHY